MSRVVPFCHLLCPTYTSYLYMLEPKVQRRTPQRTAKTVAPPRVRNDRGSEVLRRQTEELRVLPPPQWVARFFILTIFSLWLSCVCPLYDSIRGSYGVRRF